MLIERVELSKIKLQDDLVTLEMLQVGESIFCSDFKKAQSLRTLLLSDSLTQTGMEIHFP
jgi:hypothetical protein